MQRMHEKREARLLWAVVAVVLLTFAASLMLTSIISPRPLPGRIVAGIFAVFLLIGSFASAYFSLEDELILKLRLRFAEVNAKLKAWKEAHSFYYRALLIVLAVVGLWLLIGNAHLLFTKPRELFFTKLFTALMGIVAIAPALAEFSGD